MGAIGRRKISLIVSKLSAAPKFMYKIETNIMTEYVKSLSMKRCGRKIFTASDSLDFSVSFVLAFLISA
jgi:hypothetical protein